MDFVWEQSSSWGREERRLARICLLFAVEAYKNQLKNIYFPMTKLHLIEKREFTKRDGTTGYAYGFILPNGKVGSFSSAKGDHVVHPAVLFDAEHAVELDLVPTVFGDKMNLREA